VCSLAVEMSDSGCPHSSASEAAVFACLRIALASPLVGDRVQCQGREGVVTDVTGNRYVCVQQSEASAAVDSFLMRDVLLASPLGRSFEAHLTRHSTPLLSYNSKCSVDASGHVSVDRGLRDPVTARWRQYRLIRYCLSDIVEPGRTPVRLLVKATGSDQVSTKQQSMWFAISLACCFNF
jgi:hypothetical protein